MAAFIKQFYDRGGSVRMPPHRISQRQSWMAQAKRFRESWDDLPAARRTDELKSGLAYMWYSIRQPRCIVALLNWEPVAALSYKIHLDRIDVEVVGSRQMEEARGAGIALEFALAEEAGRRGLGVRSTYTWSARNFHRRLGRRLDLRGDRSSDWTQQDCQFLVRGIKELL